MKLGYIKRLARKNAGAGCHLPVDIIDSASPPRVVGERGYYTTPSGKTVVRYPGAYGWPTVYHRSTERVEVGKAWLRKQFVPASRERFDAEVG